MDRMLVVIFDNEEQAHEGFRAFERLDDDGFVAIYDAAILTKSTNGAATARRVGKFGPRGTLAGLAVGSLIGLLAGPAGLAVGFASGTLLGALSDFENSRVGSDFVGDVANELVPGKAALIAEIEEEEIGPVDLAMQPLNGWVMRRSLRELKDEENEQDIAALKAEIAHSKKEHAEARAEGKTKLEARIAVLNAKLRQAADQVKAKREAVGRQAEARVETLDRNAARAREDARVKRQQWVAKAKHDYHKKMEELNAELY